MTGRAARSLVLCALAACGDSHVAMIDAPSSPWSTGPMLPLPRLEPGVTALGQSLVVLGGFSDTLMNGLPITDQVDVLDTTSNMWMQLPAAPVKWTHIQLAAIGSTLYLLGGLAGQQYVAHGEAFALDTLASPLAWRQLATMPSGYERGSAAVVLAPPRVYLFGGASTTGALATNLYYDTIADRWGTDVPDLPAGRSHPAGMRRVDGAFVVTGGLTTLDASSQAADTYLLMPSDTQWQTKMPMPDARGGCAYGVLQGQLVCAGGEGGTSAFTYTESYDPLDDIWTKCAFMPSPRAGTQGAAIGQRLYVPGGAMELQFVPTDTLFVFSPLDVPTCM